MVVSAALMFTFTTRADYRRVRILAAVMVAAIAVIAVPAHRQHIRTRVTAT